MRKCGATVSRACGVAQIWAGDSRIVPRVKKRVQMVLLIQRFLVLAPVLYLELSLWAGPPYSARGARIGVWQAIMITTNGNEPTDGSRSPYGTILDRAG